MQKLSIISLLWLVAVPVVLSLVFFTLTFSPMFSLCSLTLLLQLVDSLHFTYQGSVRVVKKNGGESAMYAILVNYHSNK